MAKSSVGAGCGCLAVLVLVGFIAALFTGGGSDTHGTGFVQPPHPNQVEILGVAKDRREVADSIQKLMDAGFIRKYDSGRQEAQMNGPAWRALELDAKRGIVITLAQHFKAHGGTGRVQLLDSQSGRLLAEYNSLSGVTIH